ncbi:hypothetical protein HAX54_052893, partial [Datura stramonium]|nr:hypothetical protein [Datura stramonium]
LPQQPPPLSLIAAPPPSSLPLISSLTTAHPPKHHHTSINSAHRLHLSRETSQKCLSPDTPDHLRYLLWPWLRLDGGKRHQNGTPSISLFSPVGEASSNQPPLSPSSFPRFSGELRREPVGLSPDLSLPPPLLSHRRTSSKPHPPTPAQKSPQQSDLPISSHRRRETHQTSIISGETLTCAAGNLPPSRPSEQPRLPLPFSFSSPNTNSPTTAPRRSGCLSIDDRTDL